MIRKNPNIVDLAPPLKGLPFVAELATSFLGEKVLSNKFFGTQIIWNNNFFLTWETICKPGRDEDAMRFLTMLFRWPSC
jgi:hypothetical protein